MRILNTIVEGKRVVIEIGDGETSETSPNSILMSLEVDCADEDSLALIKYRTMNAASAVLTPLIQHAKAISDRQIN